MLRANMLKGTTAKGERGPDKGFPNEPGTIFHTSRRDFRNILVVSADQLVSACVKARADWSRANVRAVQSPGEAETLIKGQGSRIGLLVLNLDPKESMKLLELAKKENPLLEAVVVLPSRERGRDFATEFAKDVEAARPFGDKGAVVLPNGMDMMCMGKALGFLEDGPRITDVFPVFSPA